MTDTMNDTRALDYRGAGGMSNTSQMVSTIPVIVSDAPDAHRVQFKVGVQSFHIGPDYFDTKEEADWMAGQFLKALASNAGVPDMAAFEQALSDFNTSAIMYGRRSTSENIEVLMAAREQVKSLYTQALAASPPAQVAVPEGWKPVPIEPTDAMTDACYDECRKFGVMDCAVHLWDAMLEAAPEPPK